MAQMFSHGENERNGVERCRELSSGVTRRRQFDKFVSHPALSFSEVPVFPLPQSALPTAPSEREPGYTERWLLAPSDVGRGLPGRPLHPFVGGKINKEK